MRIPGIKTIRRFPKWVRAHILGGALILGYHRIADVDGDDYKICVNPSHFTEHLEVLRKYTHPISLPELVGHLRQGTLPRKSVAITFDDGYVDNLHKAKPLLEQYQIPATIFISTNYLGGNFWWDELAWLIQSPQTLPDLLQLRIQGETFEWDSNASKREELAQSLYLKLLPLDFSQQKELINTIREWSSAQPEGLAGQRPLTIDELIQLAEGGLIDIGSHTLTHPVLTALPVEKQREEILMSRKRLEEILNRPVIGFSYPNGVSTAKTREVVKESGFQYACSSAPDLIRNSRHLYQMPRFWSQDVNGDEFIKSLRPWMSMQAN